MTVLNTIELEGASPRSWHAAAEEALAEAAKTLRSIRRVDVLAISAVVEGGEITQYRAEVRLTFEVESGRP